jgi:hypothetical protein
MGTPDVIAADFNNTTIAWVVKVNINACPTLSNSDGLG